MWLGKDYEADGCHPGAREGARGGVRHRSGTKSVLAATIAARSPVHS